MFFEEPIEKKFTIYSKSNCINCRKVKDLLKKEKVEYEIVDCDDYLLDNKEHFLSFIKSYTSKELKMFPIVFYDKQFIGGLEETIIFLNIIEKSNLDFTNENF